MFRMNFSRKNENASSDKALRIDCRGCMNEPDLGDVGCMRCVCGMIRDFGEPERIFLRTGTEMEYSGEAVNILREISDVFCRSSAGRTGRKCSQCILSKDSLESEKWADFSIENIDSIIDSLQSVYVECSRCGECTADAVRYFTILRAKLESISKEAAMAAYRIVGA